MIRYRDVRAFYERHGFQVVILGGTRDDPRRTLCVYLVGARGRRLKVTHQIDQDGLCHPLNLYDELAPIDRDLSVKLHDEIERIRWVPGYVDP